MFEKMLQFHNYTYNDNGLNGNNNVVHEKEGQKWGKIASLNQVKRHQTMVYI
jgi:hypothetical protein